MSFNFSLSGNTAGDDPKAVREAEDHVREAAEAFMKKVRKIDGADVAAAQWSGGDGSSRDLRDHHDESQEGANAPHRGSPAPQA